jgi:hypothetical protein
LSVPAQDCFGLDEERGAPPGRAEPCEKHEHSPIRPGEPWARDLAEGDVELLAQKRMFFGQIRGRTESVKHVSKDGSG